MMLSQEFHLAREREMMRMERDMEREMIERERIEREMEREMMQRGGMERMGRSMQRDDGMWGGRVPAQRGRIEASPLYIPRNVSSSLFNFHAPTTFNCSSSSLKIARPNARKLPA